MIKITAVIVLLLGLSVAARAGDVGYVRCQSGEGYVYLYQTADNFQVLADLKCGQQVEIIAPQNPRARVRTADGKEGYVTLSALTASVTGSQPNQDTASLPSTSVSTPQPAPAPAASVRLPSPTFGGYSPVRGSGLEERDYSRVEIFGSYSLGIPSPSQGLPNYNGFDASVSINATKLFAAEGDFAWQRGSTVLNLLGIALNDTTHSILISGGPRFTYRQGRIAVFGHLLVGADRFSDSLGFLSAASGLYSIAGIAGGGADIELSRHMAIRNQADYVATHHANMLQNNHRFSFGVVVKF